MIKFRDFTEEETIVSKKGTRTFTSSSITHIELTTTSSPV